MLRLRQIALVAKDRDAVVDDFVAVFGLAVGYEDPHIGNIGLHNALMPIGTQLLEVVAPIVEGITAERYLERRGGDGGYMVITQTDDHATRRARVDELLGGGDVVLGDERDLADSEHGGHFPWNRGVRFSTNAENASLVSADAVIVPWAAVSMATNSPKPIDSAAT